MTYTDPSQWHDAAKLFPMLPDTELQELAEDIKAHGLLNPIVLHDGKVLDGRNRLMACQRAGVDPSFAEWESKGIAPVAWVISQNLMRRQMTAGQRAAVAVEAKPLLEAEARKNQLAHLKQGGNSRSVKIDETGNQPTITAAPVVAIDVRKTVARQFDVSAGYVHEAQKIKETNEAVFAELKAGTVSLPKAKRKIGAEANKPQVETIPVKKFTESIDPDWRVSVAYNSKGSSSAQCLSDPFGPNPKMKITTHATLSFTLEWRDEVGFSNRWTLKPISLSGDTGKPTPKQRARWMGEGFDVVTARLKRYGLWDVHSEAAMNKARQEELREKAQTAS